MSNIQMVSPEMIAAILAKDWAEVMALIAQHKRNAQLAEVQFLLAIRYVELEAGEEILAATGFLSFERFLKTHCHVRESRYRDFVAVLERDGEEAVLERGVDASLASIHIATPDGLTKYNTAVAQWTSETGVKPSMETSKRIACQVEPREKTPAPLRRATELETLREENARLRAHVAKLQKEMAAKDKEIAKLRRGPKAAPAKRAEPRRAERRA